MTPACQIYIQNEAGAGVTLQQLHNGFTPFYMLLQLKELAAQYLYVNQTVPEIDVQNELGVTDTLKRLVKSSARIDTVVKLLLATTSFSLTTKAVPMVDDYVSYYYTLTIPNDSKQAWKVTLYELKDAVLNVITQYSISMEAPHNLCNTPFKKQYQISGCACGVSTIEIVPFDKATFFSVYAVISSDVYEWQKDFSTFLSALQYIDLLQGHEGCDT